MPTSGWSTPSCPTAAGSTTTWPPASKDARLDTNVCAYLATGAWHRYVSTGDLDGLGAAVADCRGRGRLRPALAAARRIHPLVARLLPGSSRSYALLTGSSSIYHSLRCAIACAERLGHERPDWELAAGRLAHALAHQPDAFAPKVEFAMDWYYPVLAGALSGEAARRRIEARGRPSSWRAVVFAACRPANG